MFITATPTATYRGTSKLPRTYRGSQKVTAVACFFRQWYAEPATRRVILKDSANNPSARRAGAKDMSLGTARVRLHSAAYSSEDSLQDRKHA